jgi:hypothetical protein
MPPSQQVIGTNITVPNPQKNFLKKAFRSEIARLSINPSHSRELLGTHTQQRQLAEREDAALRGGSQQPARGV